ncbi:MAG: TVP38/TMEM64 family protein [Anaerolineae bacterium]|nr:TVP38/TMEM64 family protein [Anaerolineae bacterium]
MSHRWTRAAALAARVLVGLAAAALCVLLLTTWRRPLLTLFEEPGHLQGLVRQLGPAGPLAVVLLQAAQVLLAPIPGQAVSVASGFLFGPWLGTLYSMLGLLAGTVAGLWLVRRWGRPLVERLVDPQTLARIDQLAGALGAPLLFLVCVLPFLPDDLIVLAAGLSRIPLAAIVAAALLGRLPSVLLAAHLGRGATALRLTTPQWLVIIVATLVLTAIAYALRGHGERAVWSLLERIGRQRESKD